MSKETAKNVLEALLEGTDYAEALTEQQRQKLTGLINETVDARVSAKLTLLEDEFKAKEKTLTESIEAEKAKLAKEAEENEKVLVEQAESYKQKIEETAVAKVKEYKETAEKSLAEKAQLFKEEIEKIAFEEAKAYKDKKDAALVEEVKKFKSEMIDKVSDYLEAKLEKIVPTEQLDAAAKLEVYEPLVKGIMENFSRNFIKLDDTSYSIIKESKETITRLESELQESKKESIKLAKEKREVERNYKIEALSEGLTDAQRSKARKLLEGVEVDDLQTKFKQVRDIIIESEAKPTVKKEEPKAAAKPVEALVEGEKKPAAKVVNESAKEQQSQTVIEMQMKKVLTESATSKVVAADEKKQTLNESENAVSKWAERIVPKHARG